MRFPPAGFLLLAVSAAACANDATSTRERGGHFELVQPAAVVALPGYPLYDSIKVRLVDRDGDVMPHVAVQWLAQDGSVSGESETDGNGVAAAQWTLGPVAGGQSLVVKTLQDSSLTVEIEAEYFTAERVAANYTGGCAVRSGDLWCWSTSGGASAARRRSVSRVEVGGVVAGDLRPFRVTTAESFVDVRITGQMICGLRTEGTVGCLPGSWPGDSLPVIQSVTAPPLRALSGAPTFLASMCGLTASDSTPYCWDQSRQAEKVDGAPPLVELGGLAGFTSLATGGCGRQVDSTTWCWGGVVTPPATAWDTLRFTALSVSATRGCGLRPSQEAWCWEFSGGVPAAVLAMDGLTALSVEDGIALGLRGGRLIRWEMDNAATWSTAPVTSVADRLFTSLDANTVYSLRDPNDAVFVAGEHYYTNNSGYYNDQYYPLQPVED